MKNVYRIKLACLKKINNETIKLFFDYLKTFEGGKYFPAKCDVYEPVKTVLHPNDYNKQVNWLLQPASSLICKTKDGVFLGIIENKTKAEIFVIQNGKKTPFGNQEENIFKTEITIWIKSNDYNHLAIFIKELYERLECDYGFLTLEDDYLNQNFIRKVIHNDITIEEFVGDNLNDFIPGIYWLNFFGNLPMFHHIHKINLNDFYTEKLKNNSLLVKVFEHPSDYNKRYAFINTKKLRSLIGEKYIFDKSDIIEKEF